MNQHNNGNLLLAVAGAGVLLAGWAALRRLSAYDFHGKTVLITGGSRGLGLVLAREFGRAGARVAVCGRDEATVQRAREQLALSNIPAFAIAADVTDQAQVTRLVRTVGEHYGRVDVLANNAGTIAVGPMDVMTLADYEEAMKLHFWAPLYTTLAVLPEMRRRGEGRIVNIASIGGKISVPHLLPYSASKFALVGLSTGLRAEPAKDGIVVTTVCPGLMRTGSPRNANFKGQHRDEYAWFSIADSLPVVSMNVERAARQVVAACQRGDAEVVLSLPAQLAMTFQSVFPELAAKTLAAVNRLMPTAGGIGNARAKGKESTSALSPSWLTTLGEHAARRYNQMETSARAGQTP